ncbi:antibiotic biosynthesis monooxygenase [Streptomyces niveiscabiei]|uniref:antibiotic biosynthesis monooxygenase family protein n=1 Tax=Streptomyces niveiscabiei TaxID=164115 RepID=UPI0029BE790C|nr:antibiotic biosynthesis monooxygenase [Streptomyces niveiscabiei]MDX3386239.1 antibiotic biosynthesis monooxygenase [Streptomyces niveiscabiei]
MTDISAGRGLATFINVFPTKPRDQHKVVDLIVKAHEEFIRHRPGYVSGNVHRSVDGYQVVDYTQWRRREDFEAVVRDPAAAPHFAPIGELSQGRQLAYDVVYSHTGDGQEGTSRD